MIVRAYSRRVCAYLLVAEDNPAQAEGLRRYLAADGHDAVVVHDGEAALAQVRRRPPDLLVLDLMMPGLDGLSLSRILRTESDVPILMLTARSGEEEMLAGFAGGADDYLTKPYSPRELLARTRALLRHNAGRQVIADSMSGPSLATARPSATVDSTLGAGTTFTVTLPAPLTKPDPETGQFGLTEVGRNGDFGSAAIQECRRKAFTD